MLPKLDIIPHATTPLFLALAYALAGCVVVLYVAHRALGKRGKTVPRRVLIGLPVVAVIGVIIAYSIMVVDIGTVQVVRLFGKVMERRFDPGVHIIFPGSRHDHMWVRRQIFEISTLDADAVTAAGSPQPEAQRALALSADRIALSSDITFPYLINPDLAWKVFSDISPGYETFLLVPAARAAIREATAAFTWSDAITTKRAELEESIHSIFKRIVEENLVATGFTKEQAEKTFVLMPIQVRRIAPPRALLAAVSDRLAADVNLERQTVLNKIAELEAERRGNEGLGVRMLFDKLPKGFTAEQLQGLLYALADKQRADSMLKAVERDQVKVMIMGGGAPGAPSAPGPAVAIPAP